MDLQIEIYPVTSSMLLLENINVREDEISD